MKIDCPHWSAVNNDDGRCAIGRGGGRPSRGVCRLCLSGVNIDAAAPADVVQRRSGPGASLKRLLARLGMTAGGCACNARAAEMDARGPLWCLRHIPHISRWLIEEAERRRLPMRGDWPLGAALLIVVAVLLADD